MFAALVVYVSVNDVLFGGVTPYAAARPGAGATGADGLLEHLERIPRLATVWVDPEEGLLRWAPVLALAFVGAYLLWRSRHERLARVVAEHVDAEVAAALLLLVVAAATAVAAFGAPRLDGPWPPARHLVVALPVAGALAAWGLRRAPRAGALLGLVTVGQSAWLLSTGNFV